MKIDFSKLVTKEQKAEEAIKQAHQQWKQARSEAVNNIKVTTTSGNVFDGDETSQARMARAILGLESAGPDATVTWVLADNTPTQATALELREALALAGAEQARLWVKNPKA